MTIPGESIWNWSTTANLNGAADPGIAWPEGMPRDSVNNSARSTLAAVAYHRNQRSGAIVTTGTPAAQAFASGHPVPFTAPIPTGFNVRLKIGAGLTSTGAMTLSMDGIGAAIVRDNRGFPVGAGAVVAGGYYDFLFDGTYWRLLAADIGFAPPQCGRLVQASAIALTFGPFKGDTIKIGGVIYAIPPAGLAGLTNTGVYVNNIAGQNLLPTTTIWCLQRTTASATWSRISTPA